MSDDQERILATFPRGERGEVRLTRCSFKGSVFTKLQLWYPTEAGDLRPGRQVVTIRDSELGELIHWLKQVERRVGQPPARPAKREERDAPVHTDALDSEGVF